MNYLHKFNFLGPSVDGQKEDIYISASAINFLTWYKKDNSEGTMFHLTLDKVNHVISALPDMVNQITLDGLLFKCTAHRAGESGAMKKYSAWINPGNIAGMYQDQPDSTFIFFKSGESIAIANRAPDVLKGLIEHNKKYQERKKIAYGNKDKKAGV